VPIVPPHSLEKNKKIAVFKNILIQSANTKNGYKKSKKSTLCLLGWG
jgi:hypothetical protein